jgi:hypothetical protein
MVTNSRLPLLTANFGRKTDRHDAANPRFRWILNRKERLLISFRRAHLFGMLGSCCLCIETIETRSLFFGDHVKAGSAPATRLSLQISHINRHGLVKGDPSITSIRSA